MPVSGRECNRVFRFSDILHLHLVWWCFSVHKTLLLDLRGVLQHVLGRSCFAVLLPLAILKLVSPGEHGSSIGINLLFRKRKRDRQREAKSK